MFKIQYRRLTLRVIWHSSWSLSTNCEPIRESLAHFWPELVSHVWPPTTLVMLGPTFSFTEHEKPPNPVWHWHTSKWEIKSNINNEGQ